MGIEINIDFEVVVSNDNDNDKDEVYFCKIIGTQKSVGPCFQLGLSSEILKPAIKRRQNMNR